MLSEQSYLISVSIYLGAAGFMLLCLAWWIGHRWGAGWASLVVLLSAALLLTPAYPREGVETLAPALIVAGFQIFTEGLEAAEHALRPLVIACAIAVVLALLLRLTVFRARAGEKPPPVSAREEG